MAETKKVAKMAQIVKDDGSVEFKFSHGPVVAAALDLFPQNVKDYFALLGMRTKLRNFTVPDEDEKEATPERMHEKLENGIARLRAGELRVSRSGEDKPAASTLVLEAALIYRKMKAALKASGGTSFDGWQATEIEDTIESLRPMVEGMQDTITNPDDVEKAKTEAAAKEGATDEDIAAAAAKAAVTQLDQLKATELFKAAMAEAKDVRAQAAKAALLKKAVAEISNNGGI
jgi:hypothetical protein